MDELQDESALVDRRALLALGAAASLMAAMPASAQSSAVTAGRGGPATIPVAVLLGEHSTLIDFAGPWEILSSACYEDKCPGFYVYSVADSRKPVLADDGRATMGMSSAMPWSGLSVMPDFTFADAPQPRILIAGGQSDPSAAMLDWIRRVAPKTEVIASVCTGAYVLAKTGLLDGHKATTNRSAYDDFHKSFPKVDLVRGVRFVEDGPFATSTGLTAGMDLALRLTDRFYGRKIAEALASYEEWPGSAWQVNA